METFLSMKCPDCGFLMRKRRSKYFCDNLNCQVIEVRGHGRFPITVIRDSSYLKRDAFAFIGTKLLTLRKDIMFAKMLQTDEGLGNRQETVKRPWKMNVKSFCNVRAQKEETEMKRGTPPRLTSPIEREKVKEWRYSMCGMMNGFANNMGSNQRR